jgi:hypothetical protein
VKVVACLTHLIDLTDSVGDILVEGGELLDLVSDHLRSQEFLTVGSVVRVDSEHLCDDLSEFF